MSLNKVRDSFAQVVEGYPLSCNATLNLHHSNSDNLAASKPAGILFTGQSECKRAGSKEGEAIKKNLHSWERLGSPRHRKAFDVADLCWT